MAFPGTRAPRVDLFYSGLWNNITTDVLSRDRENSIVIHRGRESEDQADTPATCTLSLRNPTGTYSPRNPSSALYGLIGRNTPVRVGLGLPPIGNAAQTTVDSTNLVAPTVTAEATGILFAAWVAPPVGNITVPGGFTAAGEQDGTLSTCEMARKAAVGAGATGTSTATFSTTATAQATIAFHIPAATFVASASNVNTLGNDATLTPSTVSVGSVLVAVCAWSEDMDDRMQPPKITSTDRGAGWYLIADSGPSSAAGVPRIMAWGMNSPTTTPGVVSLGGKRDGAADTFMRIFTLTVTDPYMPRFVGEIAEFPVKWDHKGGDVYTPVEAAGISRRLSSVNQLASRSTTFEAFSRRSSLIAYWPMEDQSGAGQFASGLDNGTPATFAPGGTSAFALPVPAAYTSLPGSDPLPTFTSAGAIGILPSYTDTNALSFGQIVATPGAGTGVGANFFRLELTGGDVAAVSLEYRSDTLVRLKVDFTDGTAGISEDLAAPSDGLNGEVYVMYCRLWESGADAKVDVVFVRITPGQGITTPVEASFNRTYVTKTIGRAVRMLVGIEASTGNTLHTNGIAFGHVFVVNTFQRVFSTTDVELGPDSAKALVAWDNQKVSDRLYRLCADNAVRIAVRHNDTDQNLGFQVTDTLIGQLRDAEATGVGGQLFEPTGYIGFGWRDRISKESPVAPRMTFDYTALTLMDPLEPTDDDRRTANDFTVTRRGGGSGRAIRSTGPLSILAPPSGVGRYQQTRELSLYTDSLALPSAQWLMHQGTINEARWPTLTFDLSSAGNSAKLVLMGYLDVGDTVRLTNLPAWVPPGPVDLILEGYTEQIGSHRWIVTANLSSATPYAVGLTETASYDRVGDDGQSTLVSGITTTATSLSVATATGYALYTVAAADLPVPILVEGEEMSATAITGATSPQTFTVTRSVNGVVKTHGAGALVTVARAAYVGL